MPWMNNDNRCPVCRTVFPSSTGVDEHSGIGDDMLQGERWVEHVDSLSIVQLKLLMSRYNIPVHGCIEKQDLIDRLTTYIIRPRQSLR